MANHYEDTFPLEGDLETKRKYVIDSLNNLNWRYNSISKNEFEARLYVSMSSWGEKVNISFNERSIYLRSKSIGMTFADWGKNKNNVLKFMSELNSVIKNSVFVNESPLQNIKQDSSEFSTLFIEKISNTFRLFENEVLSKEEFRNRKNNPKLVISQKSLMTAIRKK